MKRILKKRQSGFTLLEVLVAILIFGVAAVGLLALQVATIKSAVDAKYQQTALQLASELAVLMQSNQIVASTPGSPYFISRSDAAVSSTVGSGLNSASNGTQVASADIEQWYARVYENLPGARVVVCFDSEPYDADGIPLWACSQSGTIPYIKIGWSLRLDEASAASLNQGPGIILPVGVCNPVDSTSKVACASSIL